MKISLKKNQKWIILSLYLTLSMTLIGYVWKIMLLIVFVFLIAVISNYKLHVNLKDPYFISELLFSAFVFISYIWVDKQNLGAVSGIVIGLPSTLFLIIFSHHFIHDYHDIEMAMLSIVATSILSALYAVVNTPLSVWSTAGMIRLGDYGLTSHNMLGMVAAFSAGICYYFLISYKNHRMRYILLVLAELIIVLLSGSRKAILGFILCVFGLYVIKSRNYKIIRNLLIAFVLIAICYYALINIDLLYTLVGKRVENLVLALFTEADVSEGSITERAYYRKVAIELFEEHPIIGVGIHGFRAYMNKIGYSHVAYSHCNFTELLACYGCIGFLLYYFLKIRMIIEHAKVVVRRDKLAQLLWISACVLLILEYGFVSYYSVCVQFLWLVCFRGLNLLRKLNMPEQAEQLDREN